VVQANVPLSSNMIQQVPQRHHGLQLEMVMSHKNTTAFRLFVFHKNAKARRCHG
jgi:hypothetical protein